MNGNHYNVCVVNKQPRFFCEPRTPSPRPGFAGPVAAQYIKVVALLKDEVQSLLNKPTRPGIVFESKEILDLEEEQVIELISDDES